MRPYYEHAGITIYHGDAREVVPVLENIETVLTDPPYGVRERTTRKTNGRGKPVGNGFKHVDSRDWKPIIGDDKPFDPAFLLDFPKVILWGANHYCNKLPGKPHWLIWDKREETSSDDNADCELAWSNLKGPARIHRQLWRGICKRGSENISRGRSIVHPTQKPIALMKWCLTQAKSAGIVCDPYFGSGTTLRAAKDLGLSCIGVELDEEYCEKAATRLSQEVLELA